MRYCRHGTDFWDDLVFLLGWFTIYPGIYIVFNQVHAADLIFQNEVCIFVSLQWNNCDNFEKCERQTNKDSESSWVRNKSEMEIYFCPF